MDVRTVQKILLYIRDVQKYLKDNEIDVSGSDSYKLIGMKERGGLASFPEDIQKMIIKTACYPTISDEEEILVRLLLNGATDPRSSVRVVQAADSRRGDQNPCPHAVTDPPGTFAPGHNLRASGNRAAASITNPRSRSSIRIHRNTYDRLAKGDSGDWTMKYVLQGSYGFTEEIEATDLDDAERKLKAWLDDCGSASGWYSVCDGAGNNLSTIDYTSPEDDEV